MHVPEPVTTVSERIIVIAPSVALVATAAVTAFDAQVNA